MAERLGHATVGITLDTYSHVTPGLARQAADDLATLILGGDGAGASRDDPPRRLQDVCNPPSPDA